VSSGSSRATKSPHTFEFEGLVEASLCKRPIPIERIQKATTASEAADIEGAIYIRFGTRRTTA
jgi:hypothetical protein